MVWYFIGVVHAIMCILVFQYTIYNDHYDHYKHQLWPVLVWFNSGSFVEGAAQVHPGHVLATEEVIVVTVNYRLGAFGKSDFISACLL